MGCRLVLVCWLLVSAMTAPQYCEVSSETYELFMLEGTTPLVDLGQHLRGSNLDITGPTTNQTAVIPPVKQSVGDLGFEEGFSIFDSDVLKLGYSFPQTAGVVLASNGSTVAIKYGEVSGNDFMSGQIKSFPMGSNTSCYSGKILSEAMDVVIDCQSKQKNLVCVANYTSNTVSCKSMAPFLESKQRSSALLSMGKEKYFLTATLTNNIEEGFKNQTFVTVYDVADGNVEFNFIVDRRVLGLDSLSITDMVVKNMKGSTYVILADADSRLVKFTFSPTNQVSNIIITDIIASPSKLGISQDNTVLVGVAGYVVQMCKCGEKVIRKYQLETKDSQVLDLQASFHSLTVLNSKNQLFIFSRAETSYQYLISKQKYSDYSEIMLSPYYHTVLVFDSTHQRILAISRGYFSLKAVTKDSTFEVVGNSSGLICKLNIQVKIVTKEDLQGVITKKHFKKGNYKFEAHHSLPLQLDTYFGGNELSYAVSLSNPQIKYEFKHVSDYRVEQHPQYYLTEIVGIDQSTFYFIGVNETYLTTQKCLIDQMVKCTLESSEYVDGKIVSLEAGKRQDGSYLLTWVYEKNKLQMYTLGSYLKTIIFYGTGYHYSSSVVAPNLVFYVQKYENVLLILDDLKLWDFNVKSFSQEELQLMGGGFYPREVVLNPHNPNIFYVKFPTSIVTMSYQNGKVKILANLPVFSEIIPDQQWMFVVGKGSALTFTPEGIMEFTLINDLLEGSRSQFIDIDGNFTLPVQYCAQTNSVYVRTIENKIIFLRLNVESVNTVYYSIEIEEDETWAAHDNWVILADSGKAIWVNEEPLLEFLPATGDFKQSAHFSLDVSGITQHTQESSGIAFINYPEDIKPISVEADPIKLPVTADKNVVQFPIDEYFDGNVANYEIVCAFSLEGKMKLISPFRHINTNELIDSPLQVQTLADFSGAIVLGQNNVLSVVDQDNKLLSSFTISTIRQCTRMGLGKNNVVVFCTGDATQQIRTYVINDGIIGVEKKYALGKDVWVQNAQSIQVQVATLALTVYIHDGDVLDNSLTKHTEIKIFSIGTNLKLTNIINGKSFGASGMPINSMSVNKGELVVSLGNIGIGYMDMSEKTLNGRMLNLMDNDHTQDYVLDDSVFLKVQHLGSAKKGFECFVSSSTGLGMVIDVAVKKDSLSLTGVKEVYNQYGHQTIINWAQITGDHILLSYFNQTTMLQSIVLYTRTEQKINNFYAALNRTVSEEVKPPTLAVLPSSSSNYLFGSSVSSINTNHLSLYNVTESFAIEATYEEPGNFERIKVVASNAYESNANNVKVAFEVEDDGGVKWYTILIIICLVVILIGVGIGMYLRRKGKKTDKNVSLVTESEELDEEI